MSNVVDKIFVCTNSSTLYTAQCTLSFPCKFAFFPQNMMQDYDTNIKGLETRFMIVMLLHYHIDGHHHKGLVVCVLCITSEHDARLQCL